MNQNLIEQVRSVLIFTDRKTSGAYRSALAKGKIVKISRGAYLPSSTLEFAEGYWLRQEIVAIARVLAVFRRMGEGLFCRETALLLYGIQQFRIPVDVYLRSGHAYGNHMDFPEVRLKGTLILGAGKVRISHAMPTHSEQVMVGGIPCVGLVQLLVECSTFRSTRDAVAAASSLLSAIVRRPSTREADGRGSAESVRSEALRGIVSRDGFPRRRRSQRIVEAASKECDSIAEAYMVALLHEAQIYGWKQQYEVQTYAGKRLLDFAFPDHKIAIEIEGKIKDSLFSRSATDGHVAYYNRTAELALLGWMVVPVPASDVLYYPEKVMQTVAAIG